MAHPAADTHVGAVTDDLVFDLLPALETLLDEHLRAEGQRLCREVAKFFLVVRKARAETAEGEGRAENDWVANDLGGVKRGLNRRDGRGLRGRNVDLWRCEAGLVSPGVRSDLRPQPTIQRLHEQVTVLADLERPDRRAEHLNAEPLEHAHLVELDADVERTLPAKREQDAIGALLFEHVGDIVGRDGEEVDLAREVVRGLDGCDVWVDEDGFDLAFPEGLDCLGAWERRGIAWSAGATCTSLSA